MVSGLEPLAIAGLVCAIINAFTGSASLFKRVPREKRLRYHHVGRSLDYGPEKVQGEFDRYVARLGRRFERGDEQARQELRNVAFKLQSNLLDSIYRLLDGRNLAAFEDIHDLSEQGRRDAVWALNDQYQRIMSAAPFARVLSDGDAGYSQRQRQIQAPTREEGRVVAYGRDPNVVDERRGRDGRSGGWEVVKEREYHSYDSTRNIAGRRPRSRSRSRRRSSSRSRYSVY